MLPVARFIEGRQNVQCCWSAPVERPVIVYLRLVTSYGEFKLLVVY